MGAQGRDQESLNRHRAEGLRCTSIAWAAGSCGSADGLKTYSSAPASRKPTARMHSTAAGYCGAARNGAGFRGERCWETQA